MLACGEVISEYLRAKEKELADQLPVDYVRSRGVGGTSGWTACLSLIHTLSLTRVRIIDM